MVSTSPVARTIVPITALPSDGMNLVVIDQGDHWLNAAPTGHMHQWFAGAFTHLPTDRETTVNICMAGKSVNPRGFKVQLWKWVGLRPLLTYADPRDARSYEWFRRDAEGRWVSGDLWKTGEARYAGSGPVPEQQAIPAEMAEEFLSADGHYWQPWREIETVEVFEAEERFQITHRFARPTAALAIHVPYTYTYQQAFLHGLQDAQPEGVYVDEIGATSGGRALQIIRVDDPQKPTPLIITEDGEQRNFHIPSPAKPALANHRVLLICAREHATEHTGSWVVQGILRALLAEGPEAARLRKDTTWLLVPIYDPDGSAGAILNTLTNRFFDHRESADGNTTPAEVVAYARYLRAFVNSGRPIYAATSFYGLECNEGHPVCSPAIAKADYDVILRFNRLWFQRLRKQRYLAGPPEPWSINWLQYRLYGWCSYFYGGIPLVFEVGDRHPKQRLTLEGTLGIGQSYPAALIDYLESKAGQQRMLQTRLFLKDRQKNMDLWYRTSISGTQEHPTIYDLLGLGY